MCKSLYTYLTICCAFEKPRWLLHNTADRAETVFSHLNGSIHSDNLLIFCSKRICKAIAIMQELMELHTFGTRQLY